MEITLAEWERTVVCRQFIAARETSLLPFKMLFFTKISKDSHPAQSILNNVTGDWWEKQII